MSELNYKPGSKVRALVDRDQCFKAGEIFTVYDRGDGVRTIQCHDTGRYGPHYFLPSSDFELVEEPTP
jgi:hypothetical protein